MIRPLRPNADSPFLRIRHSRARRGVALVFAICMLALLMAFLIAAQTSVMGSFHLISRSNQRIATARQVDLALARAHQALASTTQDSGQLQLADPSEEPVEVAYERLAPGAAAYDSLPGIQGHRDGDALVAITLEKDAPAWSFLVNLRGQRVGAIRIQ